MIHDLLPLRSSKAPQVVQKLVANELQAARAVVLEAAAEGTKELADFSLLTVLEVLVGLGKQLDMMFFSVAAHLHGR